MNSPTPSSNQQTEINEQLKRSPKQLAALEKKISPIPTPDQTAKDPLNRTMSNNSNKAEVKFIVYLQIVIVIVIILTQRRPKQIIT